MRILIFLLLLMLPAFSANITYFMNLSMTATCPGNTLNINATTSAGTPATDVELRLVLYSPYQGLRALMHTDKDGLASVELTKAGEYRMYINTDKYNHPRFVGFDYSKLCPLPPPKGLNISIEHNCNSRIMKITAKDKGVALKDVFITNGNWSSLSDSNGAVVFPFEEGGIWITANKSGFKSIAAYTNISCAPPECLRHEDCTTDHYCWGGDCLNISGECGFAENHTWFVYECCLDTACDSGNECIDHFCMPLLNASNATIISNITNTTKGNDTSNNSKVLAPMSDEAKNAYLAVILPLFLLFKTGNR
jgi:hypothetical protein